MLPTSQQSPPEQVRKRTNALDNLLTSRAVDALMNYETVKLFTNEQLEVGAYDTFLTSYQAAAVETEVVSARLNAGQVRPGLLTPEKVPSSQDIKLGW